MQASGHRGDLSRDFSRRDAARAVQKRGTKFSDDRNLCELLLARIDRLKDALDEVERSHLGRHLGYCGFNDVKSASVLPRALYQLSANRIGAIIALERDISLQNYAESGTLLDAELSVPLLLSIFYPATPLHDGAVIVRGKRVLAAGCILPLSGGRGHLNEGGRGARHRAGVELSEATDAIVLIVSEETGTVSLALGGRLYDEPLLEAYAGGRRTADRWGYESAAH